MTDPVTEPAPTPPTPTLIEVSRAIADATRRYIALQRARPRSEMDIADAKAEIDGLIELRDQLLAAGV